MRIAALETTAAEFLLKVYRNECMYFLWLPSLTMMCVRCIHDVLHLYYFYCCGVTYCRAPIGSCLNNWSLVDVTVWEDWEIHPRWRGCVTGARLWGLKSPRHPQLALSASCLWIKTELSATAPVPCVPAFPHAPHHGAKVLYPLELWAPN